MFRASAIHFEKIGDRPRFFSLLANAISRTLAVGDEIAIHALVVVVIDECAASFYARFGFAPLLDDGSRLFLPLRK